MKRTRTPSRLRRAAGCEGKKRFSTFTLAARTAHRQAHRKSEKFSAYACQFCGGFHVGTHVGDNSNPRGAPDSRQRYAVFAARGPGRDTLVGFSNAPDGGRIAELIRAEGWMVTRVVERRRRSA